MREIRTIGWREWVALPELGIERIKVKVDTGARSSTIHATHVEPFRRGGRPWIRFHVHPLQRDAHTTVLAEAPLLDRRSVRNSGGHSQQRYVIRTTLRFAGDEWPIELTLSGRDEMGFRMLLGREAIRRRFAVDPGRSFVAGRPPRTKKKTKKTKKKKRSASS